MQTQQTHKEFHNMINTLSDKQIHATMTYESKNDLDNFGETDNFVLPDVSNADNVDDYVDSVVESLNENREYFVLEEFTVSGVIAQLGKNTYYIKGVVSTAKHHPFGAMPKSPKNPEEFYLSLELKIQKQQ